MSKHRKAMSKQNIFSDESKYNLKNSDDGIGQLYGSRQNMHVGQYITKVP